MESNSSGKKKTVLIIEDEDHVRELLIEVVTSGGYEVIHAVDGVDGIKKTFKHTPHIVLCDVIMPRMTGLEYIKEVRKTIPPHKLPIIIVSALGTEEDVGRGIAQGATNYVTKPISFAELLLKIQLALEDPYQSHHAFVIDSPYRYTEDPPTEDLLAGTVIDLGKYKVQGRIGTGGMATVYRAVNIGYKVEAALKMLKPELSGDTNQIMRFMREITIAGQMVHPNIVRTFDAGISGGYYYYAMELLQEQDLYELLDPEDPLGEKRVISIGLQAADALAYMHAREVVHRDIKPANLILLPEGKIKLIDFGLAISIDDKTLTPEGKFFGTAGYTSPENIRGTSSRSSQSDVYSLGVTLYTLLLGKLPYEGYPDNQSILKAQCQKDLPPIHANRPSVSKDLSHILSRMTARHTGFRYPGMEDVKSDLAELL